MDKGALLRVFTLKYGKIASFDSCLMASVLLGQLGVIGNLGAALKH